MQSHPRVFGESLPFVLVDDADTHEFCSFFKSHSVPIASGQRSRSMTRFHFPGQSRSDVEQWIEKLMHDTRTPRQHRISQTPRPCRNPKPGLSAAPKPGAA